MPSPDVLVAELAAGQHGLITFDQAVGVGLSRTQVGHRSRTGRWIRVGRGVYRIGGAPDTWQQRAMAAVLGGPSRTVTSHLTVIALAGLAVAPPPRPHVTVDRGRSVRWPGAIVHSARLPAAHLTTFQGIPATTVGRALIDCAATLGPHRLEGLVAEALHRRLVRVEEIPTLWDLARRAPGRHGEVKLRRVLEPWNGPIRPGSLPEIRLRRQLKEWGFPEPELQVVVRRPDDGEVLGRVDVGWSPQRIGIEYDSEEHHGPDRWAADQARHEAIEAEGWVLLHADKADLYPGATRLRNAVESAWRSRRAA